MLVCIYEDSSLKNTTRIHFRSREQRSFLTLRHLYRLLAALSKEDVLSLIEPYTKSREVVDAIDKLGFLDIKKLAALIVWITSTVGFRVFGISLVEDLETGRPQFIGVHLEDCGWEEWKDLSRIVKTQLISEGLEDVAGRVAIVCRQALKTQRG